MLLYSPCTALTACKVNIKDNGAVIGKWIRISFSGLWHSAESPIPPNTHMVLAFITLSLRCIAEAVKS